MNTVAGLWLTAARRRAQVLDRLAVSSGIEGGKENRGGEGSVGEDRRNTHTELVVPLWASKHSACWAWRLGQSFGPGIFALGLDCLRRLLSSVRLRRFFYKNKIK